MVRGVMVGYALRANPPYNYAFSRERIFTQTPYKLVIPAEAGIQIRFPVGARGNVPLLLCTIL